MSSEQFHCLYVSIRELVWDIEYVKRLRQNNDEMLDSNGELPHECH